MLGSRPYTCSFFRAERQSFLGFRACGLMKSGRMILVPLPPRAKISDSNPLVSSLSCPYFEIISRSYRPTSTAQELLNQDAKATGVSYIG